MNEAIIPGVFFLMIVGWNAYLTRKQDKTEDEVGSIKTNIAVIKRDVKTIMRTMGIPCDEEES